MTCQTMAIYTPDELVQCWTPVLLKKLDAASKKSEPTAQEKQLAHKIEQEKFAAESWNRRR